MHRASPSRIENNYSVRGKKGGKHVGPLYTCMSWPCRPCPAQKMSCHIHISHEWEQINQPCSPMRPARPLGKLIRLARSASPPRPRCCISCSRTLGNASRVPDSMLPVAARLAYSGPRVCDGSRLKVGRDGSSVPCDPPLLMGEARELPPLILLSLPLPLPAGLALLLLPGGGSARLEVVEEGGGCVAGGPVDVVLPRRRGAR